MFSLRFDLLFPGLDAAKATARMLNAALRHPRLPPDPRELKRLRDEVRLAREKLREQQVVHRHFYL